MSIDLSVAIVAYHNYEDILAALHSIEQHTAGCIRKQIYIVDNSEPKSREDKKAAADFKGAISAYCDVQYVDAGGNLGFGKGHNFVIPYLDSKYHAIVNPDILLIDDAFSSIIRYMDENSSVGMCIPKILDAGGTIQPVYRKEPTVFDMFVRMFCRKLFPKRVASHTLQDMDYTKPFPVPFGQGSFLVVRTALFKEMRGFDDGFFMYMEDADLCKRINQVSQLMYFPGATVIHKWEKGSHKRLKLFLHHVNSMRYYFRKWGYKLF